MWLLKSNISSGLRKRRAKANVRGDESTYPSLLEELMKIYRDLHGIFAYFLPFILPGKMLSHLIFITCCVYVFFWELVKVRDVEPLWGIVAMYTKQQQKTLATGCRYQLVDDFPPE